MNGKNKGTPRKIIKKEKEDNLKKKGLSYFCMENYTLCEIAKLIMKINRQSRKTLVYLLIFYVTIPKPGKTQQEEKVAQTMLG